MHLCPGLVLAPVVVLYRVYRGKQCVSKYFAFVEGKSHFVALPLPLPLVLVTVTVTAKARLMVMHPHLGDAYQLLLQVLLAL
jgi:hypothetical protein